MRALKRNKLCLLLCLLLVGCATSKYHVLNSGEYGTELNVSSDRILLECEWIHDADTKDSYGFMMHVLDEENTVITLVQGNTLDKGSCDRRIKKIGEILRKGKNIYIAGTGDLGESRKKGKIYLFPQKGAFSGNGRVLGFAAIANEFGSCYDAYSGDEKPVSTRPFSSTKINRLPFSASL